MRWRSPQFRKARPVSPVAQHALFHRTLTLDLDWMLTVNLHDAIPRRAARSTTALRNDGVEDAVILLSNISEARFGPFSLDQCRGVPGYGERIHDWMAAVNAHRSSDQE